MTASLRASAVRGTLWLGLVNLVSKGSQIAVTVVLAAFLTETQLGLATLAVTLVNVGVVIQSMGVYDVIARTRYDPKAAAGTILTASVTVALVLAVAGVLSSRSIAGFLGAPDGAPLVAITAISLPFSAAGGVQMGYMHRNLDFRRRMLPDAGSAVIGAIVTVSLALVGLGAYALAFGLLCTAVLQPCFGLLVGYRIRPRWHAAAAAEAARWTAVVGPGAVVAILLTTVHYTVISRILGPDAVGIYSLAFRIAWVPYIMIAVVLGAVAFPIYTRLIAEGGRALLPSAVGRFTHVSLVVIGGFYGLSALLANRIVVLGDRWAPAAPVLALLCGYGLAMSLLQAWYEAIRAAGRPSWYLALQSTHLVLLSIGLVVAAPYGLVPAALAQSAAAAAMVPIAWLALHHARAAPAMRALWRGALVMVSGLAVGSLIVLGCGQLGWAGSPASLVAGLATALGLVFAYCLVVVLIDRTAVNEMRGLVRGRQV